MRQIENRGWAGLFSVSSGEEEITDPSLLRRLDGIQLFDEALSEFLQDAGEDAQQLHAMGVRGGIPVLKYDENSGQLYCSITYESPRELSEREASALRAFSDGQLVDGFGSDPVFMPRLGEGYLVQLGNL